MLMESVMKVYKIIFFGAFFALAACSKSDGGSSAPAPVVPVAPPLQAGQKPVCTDQFITDYGTLNAAVVAFVQVNAAQPPRPEDVKKAALQLEERCKVVLPAHKDQSCQTAPDKGNQITTYDLGSYQKVCNSAQANADSVRGGQVPAQKIETPAAPAVTTAPPASAAGPVPQAPDTHKNGDAPTPVTDGGETQWGPGGKPATDEPATWYDPQTSDAPAPKSAQPQPPGQGNPSFPPKTTTQPAPRRQAPRHPAPRSPVPQTPSNDPYPQQGPAPQSPNAQGTNGPIASVGFEHLALRILNVDVLRVLSGPDRKNLVLIGGRVITRQELDGIVASGQSEIVYCILGDYDASFRYRRNGEMISAISLSEGQGSTGELNTQVVTLQLGTPNMVLSCDRVGNHPVRFSDLQKAFGGAAELLIAR
jgi:hypothetical protein